MPDGGCHRWTLGWSTSSTPTPAGHGSISSSRAACSPSGRRSRMRTSPRRCARCFVSVVGCRVRLAQRLHGLSVQGAPQIDVSMSPTVKRARPPPQAVLSTTPSPLPSRVSSALTVVLVRLARTCPMLAEPSRHSVDRHAYSSGPTRSRPLSAHAMTAIPYTAPLDTAPLVRFGIATEARTRGPASVAGAELRGDIRYGRATSKVTAPKHGGGCRRWSRPGGGAPVDTTTEVRG